MFHLATEMTFVPEKNDYQEKKNIKMFSLCLHIHTTCSYHGTTWILVIILGEIILVFLLVFCFRYELLRRKIQQPLASNPPEDLNMWHNIYSGTQRFYEDKGLSRWDYKNYNNKYWHLVWGMLISLYRIWVSLLCEQVISYAIKHVGYYRWHQSSNCNSQHV